MRRSEALGARVGRRREATRRQVRHVRGYRTGPVGPPAVAIVPLACLAFQLGLGPPCAAQRPLQIAPESPQWVTKAVRGPHLQHRTFRSAAAHAEVSYHVYTPEAYDGEPQRRFPVLYWLHGTGGGLIGLRPLAARFHAAIRAGKTPPMIVVFPNGTPASLWVDSRDGAVPMETILVKELIPHIDETWRTVASRKGRIVEGFSMGGYGAARLGLKYPELFAGASVLSGGPLQREFSYSPRVGPRGREMILQTVFGGDEEYFRSVSPWALAEQSADQVRGRAALRIVIGELDEMLQVNEQFDRHLTALGIPHSFTVVPGVGHNALALLRRLGPTQWEFYRDAMAEP